MFDIREEEKDDLLAVLSTEVGRRVLHWLVYNACDIEGGTFHDKVHDGVCQSQHQNVREGRRDVAIDLQQTFKSDNGLARMWALAKKEASEQCIAELSLPVRKPKRSKTP